MEVSRDVAMPETALVLNSAKVGHGLETTLTFVLSLNFVVNILFVFCIFSLFLPAREWISFRRHWDSITHRLHGSSAVGAYLFFTTTTVGMWSK